MKIKVSWLHGFNVSDLIHAKVSDKSSFICEGRGVGTVPKRGLVGGCRGRNSAKEYEL